MKKIFLFIISAVLIFILVLTGNSSVKATTESYIDTGITTDIPNSSNGSGCFIGFNEWLKTADDLYSFLELEFGQNCQYTDFIGRLGEQVVMAQNLGYIDADFKPCILYISSEDLLNKWLRDNLFIEYGSTYQEGITGVSNGEYSPVGKEGFYALHQLLRLRGELQLYVLSPADIPGVFYKLNNNADSLTDKYYIFSEIKKPYVLNNTWQYKPLEYDCPVEECEVLDIPDSVGKVNQISSNIYDYVYSGVYYNDEFGYYSLSQSDTQTIQLTRNQLPSFVFDSNGKLKDVYISKQNNLWTMPEVKNIYESVKILGYVDSEYYMYDGKYDLQCYIVYVSFIGYSNLLGEYKKYPIDTIEEFSIRYAYTPRYSKFSEWLIKEGWKKRKLTYITSTCVRGDTFTDYGLDHNFWCFLTGNYPKSDVIQKGDYVISQDDKEIHFDFKIYLTNDEGLSKEELKNNDYLFLTPIDYKPYQLSPEILDCVVSYQSIIYNLKNISYIPAFPESPDPGLTIWEIILIVLITILILIILLLLIKFITLLKNKKK